MGRQVFPMRFLDQLEVEAITQILQRNENTVKISFINGNKKIHGNSEIYSLVLGESL
jgi:hypothetical protein